MLCRMLGEMLDSLTRAQDILETKEQITKAHFTNNHILKMRLFRNEGKHNMAERYA